MESKVSDKLKSFFTQFKIQTYKKGEILIRADEDPSGIFYLKEGIVKEYVISKKGDEVVVNMFKPVSFFPMSWAINNTSNEYYFEAMTDVSLHKAPREKTVEFLMGNSDVLFDLLSRVYRGVDGILTRMAYLMSSSAYARLVTELVILGKRFGTSLSFSEKDLGAQSGMTRETVSREMAHLKSKGLINFSNHTLVIKDLGMLEAELQNF
jgi:CRP-like cAMP-binding protein